MALSVPAIIKSNSDSSISLVVGLTTNFSPTKPILTPAIIFVLGTSERALHLSEILAKLLQQF